MPVKINAQVSPAEKKLLDLVRHMFSEEYSRGRADAIQAITAAAAANWTRDELPPSLISRVSRGGALRQRARKGATISAVRQVISENPGLRGVEIARKVAEISPEASERTVRTSLRRLKLDGEIRQREGRWYKTVERIRSTRSENETGQTGEV